MSLLESNVEEKLKDAMERQQTNSLWVEKYRPINMDTFIGNESIKNKIKYYIENQDISHLLLYGPAGIGKTTIAKMLVNNINCDYIYINASSENSVDTVRDKISNFASLSSFRDKKIVILDECDFMSVNGQAALREKLETYSNNTRFILTCNYVEKIIEPIISRCQIIQLNTPSKKEIAIFSAGILTKEGVKFKPEDIKFLVDSLYPDIRRIINTCQLQSNTGELTLNTQAMIDSDYKLKILEILKDKAFDKKTSFKKIRQIFADNSVSNFTDMYKLLYDNIDDFATGHIAQVILIIAEFDYKSAMVVDKEINMMAAIIQILNEIK